jgi:hypothetical protein
VDHYFGAELEGKSNLRIAVLTRQTEIMPGALRPTTLDGAQAMLPRTR